MHGVQGELMSKPPMGVEPEDWAQLEREDPAMAKVLGRLAEVTVGMSCEEKLAAMTKSAVDFAANAGEVAPPDDIGKHQRIDRFEAQSNARNIAQHCERLERRIEILEAKAVKCKTCGCTGGNGSWFVTDSRGNVTTTERCPTCRVHSSDCSLDTDHVGKCEHIEHDGVPAAPKPSYNITPALGGIHTAAPQEQAGHAQCGLCGFVAGPNHLCTGAKP